MRDEKGFTLIELIVVIVVLGILAAVAIPKFIDLQVDARESAVEGLFGAVQSASALAHAQALVDGVSTGIITMEGTDISMVNGYPSQAAAATGELGIEDAINFEGFDYDDTVTPSVFTLTNAPTSSTNCQVEYTQAGAGGAPLIELDITVCD